MKTHILGGGGQRREILHLAQDLRASDPEADLGPVRVLIPHSRVDARTIVGMGTLVVTEVPADATAIGVPARMVRRDGI